MQAGVDPLVVVHVDRDLISLHRSAVLRLRTLGVGPDHIILLARRDALSELAVVIRVKLPADFLFLLPPNLDLHSVNWTVIRTPDRAKDHSVGFLVLVSRGREIGRAHGTPADSKYRREAQHKERRSRGRAEVEL